MTPAEDAAITLTNQSQASPKKIINDTEPSEEPNDNTSQDAAFKTNDDVDMS